MTYIRNVIDYSEKSGESQRIIKNKGLSQNGYRIVILRNEVTKDLSFEGFCNLSEKDSSLREH